jgi:broad specificity phosphatase PhoE
MFEILLIRHGIPLCNHSTKIRGCDFAEWVARYDCAPIDRNILPPPELRARLSTVPYLVTSTLRRSIESATLVGDGKPVASNSLFDEAGIPTAIPFRLPLLPSHWDGLARAAWMAGWSPQNVESFRAAKARAARAAAQLEALSREHGAVALIGHGMLNTLISHALRRSGWTGRGSPRIYWGSVVLQKSTV